MAIFCIIALKDSTFASEQNIGKEQMSINTPKYLFKILSVEDWQDSQKKDRLKLADSDNRFIHLFTEDQLDRIASTYWSHSPEYMILKIEIAKMPGRLVYEANPGGDNK